MMPGPSVQSLSCPRCGGVPLPDGGTGLLARCGSCGTLGRIEGADGLRLTLAARVERGDAWRALAAHLSAETVEPLSPHHGELIFVPFWRIETLVAGKVRGERELKTSQVVREFTDEGSAVMRIVERSLGVEPVVKEIQRHQVSLVSACPLEEFGLPTLDRQRQSPGALALRRRWDELGPLAVFDPALRAEATVLDPVVPLERAAAEAEAVVARVVDGLDAGLLPGASVEAERIDESMVLLYYPVHLLRFSLGARRGQAAVDACTGGVISARVPAPPHAAADRRFLGMLALGAGFVAGTLARAALLPPVALAGSEAWSWRARVGTIAAVALAGGTALVRAAARQVTRR